MQSVGFSDKLQITSQSSAIEIDCDHPQLADSHDNLAFKAARLLKTATGTDQGAKIKITKSIPVGAGLAGGSADAAAVLLGLNRLWDTGLTISKLRELGAELGSDIPFCLEGGTFLAEGRGERLKRTSPLPEAFILITTPGFSLSTAKIYREWDEKKPTVTHKLAGMLNALEANDLAGICLNLENALEPVVFEDHPQVKKIKEKSLQAGGLGSIMSGSGPSVVTIAGNKDQATAISEVLGEFGTVVITKPVESGVTAFADIG
jgi:4-diphosphocytidyl-2-C-methyl-D-erythritol kinase